MLEGSNVLHMLWTIELNNKYFVTVIWSITRAQAFEVKIQRNLRRKIGLAF